MCSCDTEELCSTEPPCLSGQGICEPRRNIYLFWCLINYIFFLVSSFKTAQSLSLSYRREERGREWLWLSYQPRLTLLPMEECGDSNALLASLTKDQ